MILSPANQTAIDRVFALVSSNSDIEIKGCVRMRNRDGTTDVWIRRGPLLLRGAATFTRLYCCDPWNARAEISSGKVPECAVEVTLARGLWQTQVIAAIAELNSDVDVAIREKAVAEKPSRIDNAQRAAMAFEAACRNNRPKWDTVIERGVSKRGK